MSWLKEGDIHKDTLEEFRSKPRQSQIDYPISVKDPIVNTKKLRFYIEGEYIDHSTATGHPSSSQGHGSKSSRKPANKRNVSSTQANSDNINQNENKEDSDPDDSLPLSDLRHRWE